MIRSSPTNNTNLVFEVLSSDQWVEELFAALDHGMDFTASPRQVFVIVEGFPPGAGGE